MHPADNCRQTHVPDTRMHQTVISRYHNLHNMETQPYQTYKHVPLQVTNRKCTLRMAHLKKKQTPVSWHTQNGHHPIPKGIKAFLRACINTHSSRAGGDHKRKRPKIVMSPKAQGLVSNTHHGKKYMLKSCTHDRMSGGKAAKRSNSGATAKKTTFLDETNHAAVSLTPTEDDSSRWVSTLAPQMPHHISHSNENGVLCNDYCRQRTK